jgi:outer membrane protein
MNLLRVCLLAFGVLGIWNPAFTQEKANGPAKTDTLKLSVSQAQQFALENNQSILNANLDIEAAKKKVWETTAIGLPQASAKLAFSYSPELSPIVQQFIGPNANLDDVKWGMTGTITVSQLIFSGSYLVGLQSAQVYKSLSSLNQVKSKQDVLESVTNSYINVLIARENKLILDSTYSVLSKTFSDMKAMNKQGFIEETDLDQMQITVSTVKSSLDLITRMVDISEQLLKIQLGIDLDSPVLLTDSLAPIIDAVTIEQLVATDFIVENSVSYKMLDAQVKASQLLLKLKKSEFLPDIAGYYQYQKEFNDKAFSFTPPHIIGVQMNIPIFGSGSKLAKVSQAKVDLLKAQNTRTQMSNNLKLDYYSSKSSLMNAHDKYESETVNLKLAKRIYDKALIKYTNGVISGTDLNQIQNQYLTAQSNYYKALQDLIASKSKLEKVLTNSNEK